MAVAVPRRLREAILVVVLMTIAVLVLRASRRDPSELSWFDRILLRASAPVQAVLSAIGRGVSGTWNGYVYLVDVKKENDRLTEESRRLASELKQVRLAEARVSQLEGILSLRAEVPSETLAARVVGVESSPYFRVVRVRLDRGRGEVKPRMVVLVPEGVVGRISRVYDDGYSDVLLATDPDSAIDVEVPRTGARGVLKGVAGDSTGGYRAQIPEMPRGEEVKEGDEVVTSGIGGFPRELPVGKVTKVVRPDSGLWQQVEVTPTVDFARLSEVLVVLTPPPPPDPAAGQKSPEPHRGLLVPR